MRVMLINPPYRESRPPALFPSGLGYIASVLRNGGHQVTVLDINGYRYGKEKTEELVKKAEFDVAATGGLITRYSYVKWLCGLLKKYHPKKFVLVGGALATSAPELVIKKMKCDAIVLGEGEYTILDLVNTLGKKGDLKKVRGLWFKKGKQVIKNEPRELIKNLDDLPFPAWDLFPIEIYLKVPNISEIPLNIKSINISTVRGCPFGCKFCYNVFGKRTSRVRSPDSVIAEIKELKKRYNVGAVVLGDDLFTVNRARVMEFCNKLLEQKLGIFWGATARVDIVDLEMLKKMKKAGCRSISYGVESGSQKMLDAMNKGIKVEQTKKAIRITRQVGFEMGTPFMVGAPGETPETIKETVEFIKEMDLYVPAIFITNPYPGSEFYEYAKKKGLIKDEEKFAENCGEALDMSVNLTDMSDEELLYWRDWAIKEGVSYYRRRHPLKAVKMDLHKINITLKNFGFKETLRKAIGRLKRHQFGV